MLAKKVPVTLCYRRPGPYKARSGFGQRWCSSRFGVILVAVVLPALEACLPSAGWPW